MMPRENSEDPELVRFKNRSDLRSNGSLIPAHAMTGIKM